MFNCFGERGSVPFGIIVARVIASYTHTKLLSKRVKTFQTRPPRGARVSFLQHPRGVYLTENSMLYLRDTTEVQRLALPTNGTAIKGASLLLSLASTIDRTKTDIPCSLFAYSHRYAVVEVVLPPVQDGEYSYTLTADGTPVLTGVARIGDNNKDVAVYNTIVTYEQYQD